MFTIVSNENHQVYELNTGLLTKKEINCTHELIAFASLDIVDSIEWTTNNMFLKTVDKVNEFVVTCMITPGRCKFLFLHENKSEDTIKNFFYEVYEVYVKAMLNPFLTKNSKITSPIFDMKVKNLVKKFFF